MNLRIRKIAVAASVFATWLFAGSFAAAQGGPTLVNPEQLLGTVEIVVSDRVIEINTDDADRPPDFELVFADGQSQTDYVACARVPNQGIYCLDQANKALKVSDGSAPNAFFDCNRIPAIANNGKRGGDCIAYAYADIGNVGDVHAIAANAKGKAFILNAVTLFDSSCPLGSRLGNSPFCSIELYDGRPLLNDLNGLFGPAAEGFPLGEGFYGVEQRGDFTFFPYPAGAGQDPVVLFDKRSLGLKGKIEVQGVAILQLVNPADPQSPLYYGLATVSDGRVLAYDLSGNAGIVAQFDITGTQNGAPSSEAEPQYGIAVDETGIVAVTDRSYRQLIALQPQADTTSGQLNGFALYEDPTTAGPLVRSTGSNDPVTPVLSEGKFFNFIDDACFEPGGCTLISGQNEPAASIEFEVFQQADADAVLYHVQGLPWCSLKAFSCVDVLEKDPADPADDILPDAACANLSSRELALDCLIAADVLRRVPGASGYLPEEFELNYQPLLVDVVPNAETFPPLWTGGPDVRGRVENDGLVGLLFFVTEAREQDVLTLTVDVPELLGTVGVPDDCELFGDLPAGFAIEDPGALQRLLDWNVIHRTSERFASFTGDFTGTLINSGCGSTRGRAGGASGFVYNTELSPCPGTLEGGVLTFDSQGSCTLGEASQGDTTWQSVTETPDDAVFAKAYASLLVDLRSHLEELLCEESSAGADDAILAQSACADLRANWLNVQDKARKALDATIQDSTASAGAQNFGAVQSQLQNYRSRLLLAATSGEYDPVDDPANYYGEQIAWLDKLEHIRADKLVPSIPDLGFIEPTTDPEWAEVNYP